ncbi:hypothetical protein EMPS_02024 [Entomortierella parvispora]|uniref:Cation efflux protein cytoplasmic domain-containing protein n=1 Tax=Entomortierella parvispora TaxID=205924 RepID=A0A9P3H402_9FUNG|nr:hypothetical protein EMPS_02024 [Entomortierella parvispora]
MSGSGQNNDRPQGGKRGKSRSNGEAAASISTGETTPIAQLASPALVASSTFVVDIPSESYPASPQPSTMNRHAEGPGGDGSFFSSSPPPELRREPTIGERFGRRHGQDWPTSSSCPGSRSGSRSKSRGGMRRTSSNVYIGIPAKPVMGADVFQAARKSGKDIRAIKSSKVQEYYTSLNELLDSFGEVEEVLKELKEEEQAQAKLFPQLPTIRSFDTLLDVESGGRYGTSDLPSTSSTSTVAVGTTGDNDDEDESSPLLEYRRKQRTSPHTIQLAINVSFVANIILVILKIWTVLLSDSLAVLASMIDSLMDLLSGAIIWYSARLRNNTSDEHRYPVGKARMEPLGIIVFAAVMVTSFMQVMLQAFERLVAGSEEPPVDLGVIILTLLAVNIAVKFALWLWCRTMKDSSSVLALAQDHMNDVVFNVFSTLFPVAGQFLGLWWLDAAGAIILSIYIISEWTGTCLHNIRRLTGQAATAADIQQLTYMTYRFSNTIQAIDTVRAYSVGEGLFVEVDIVLPPDTPLSQAHDLGESLQGALERLDSVERAFVHIDYNAVHAIEHR